MLVLPVFYQELIVDLEEFIYFVEGCTDLGLNLRAVRLIQTIAH